MRNVFLLLLAVVATLRLSAQSVIPIPNNYSEHDGKFVLNSTKLSTNLKGDVRENFADFLEDAGIDVELTKKRTKTNSINIDVNVSRLSELSHEGYSLNISDNNIAIEAATENGAFYAIQTLIQLVKSDSSGDKYIVSATIEDKPRFDYRGFMLDVSRHFRSKEFIFKQIDAMARYKLNNLHLHLTDAAGWRLEIDKYPLLTEVAAWRPDAVWKDWWTTGGRKYCNQDDPRAAGGFYSKSDMKEIIEYAADRYITIIPEIEMPAHSEEVLTVYPELSCSGEPYKHADFCVGNEKTFEFLENVLDEVIELFPSEYIHIGGDEAAKTAWKTCPKCQARMKEEGLKDVEQLQSYLIHRIEVYLNSKGRKLLGWDEILEGGLAPNATVMSWRGEEGGIKAIEGGHRAIMTPGGFCYFDSYQDAPDTQPEAIGGYTPLERVYSYDPKGTLTDEQTKLLYGVQANLWTEYVPTEEHAEYMIYPRLLALSEVAWSETARKSYDDFKPRAERENSYLTSKGYNVFDITKEVGNRKESMSDTDHLARGKKVKYNAPFNGSYKAAGEATLTDGKHGGWTYGDGFWQGFISKNRLDVVIDLEKSTDISSVEADFMQVVGPQVYLPTNVIISISDDGENFKEVYNEKHEVDIDTPIAFVKHKWKGSENTRYIRYQAVAQSKHGGWIFTDEIVVK